MDHACYSSATLVEIYRAYAPDGGCRVCNDGYFRHKKTCVGCWTEYLTCTGGDGCRACRWTHFMTVDGECNDKNKVVVCAGDISSEYGCSACLAGYFLSAGEYVSCRETSDGCAGWTATTCHRCTNRSTVLVNGKRVGMESAEHFTAVDNSRCTKCTFRRGLTDAGDVCTTHSVWLVVLLALPGRLLILTVTVVGVFITFHAVHTAKHRRGLARTVWILATDQSNVQFVPTNKRCVMANTRCVVFGEDAIPVDGKTMEHPRDGNSWWRRFNVKDVGKDRNEGRPPRVIPGQQLHHPAHNISPTV